MDDRERCLFGFRREVAAEHIGEQGVDHGMKTLVDEAPPRSLVAYLRLKTA